jgi:transketolase
MDTVTDKPAVVIAKTIKGKGVSFMENNPAFHGAAPSDEQLAIALSELGVKA